MALFAGAGGGILGGKLLGWECVCAVEWEPYPAAVLAARQNEGFLPPFPIWDDVQTFDGRPWRGLVDVVSGGFPCQDISAAGKGAGITGDRSGMWKHMARIIGEVRPRYVLVENSPVLTSRGLDVVLGDLAALGYDAEWGVLGAVHAGAPHQRERIWVLAHTNGARLEEHGQLLATVPKRSSTPASNQEPEETGSVPNADSVGCYDVGEGQSRSQGKALGTVIAHCKLWGADGERLAGSTGCDESQGRIVKGGTEVGADPFTEGTGWREQFTEGGKVERNIREWWSTEPDVGRVADGVAARVDRLSALGNGQVPQVMAMAFCILHERLSKRVGNGA